MVVKDYTNTYNPLQDPRICLLQQLQQVACYHMDTESSNDEVTFFPGHCDKPFVHTAWFVPLGATAFFTVLSVPALCNVAQDDESHRQFNEWKSRLLPSESKRVDDFLRDFDV